MLPILFLDFCSSIKTSSAPSFNLPLSLVYVLSFPPFWNKHFTRCCVLQQSPARCFTLATLRLCSSAISFIGSKQKKICWMPQKTSALSASRLSFLTRELNSRQRVLSFELQMCVKVVTECPHRCLLKTIWSLCVNVDSGVLAALRLVQTATITAWGVFHHLLKVFTDLSIGQCISFALQAPFKAQFSGFISLIYFTLEPNSVGFLCFFPPGMTNANNSACSHIYFRDFGAFKAF